MKYITKPNIDSFTITSTILYVNKLNHYTTNSQWQLFSDNLDRELYGRRHTVTTVVTIGGSWSGHLQAATALVSSVATVTCQSQRSALGNLGTDS